MPPVISVPDSVALKNYLRGVCGDPKVAGFGVIANGYNNANSCSARVSDPHGKVYRFLCSDCNKVRKDAKDKKEPEPQSLWQVEYELSKESSFVFQHCNALHCHDLRSTTAEVLADPTTHSIPDEYQQHAQWLARSGFGPSMILHALKQKAEEDNITLMCTYADIQRLYRPSGKKRALDGTGYYEYYQQQCNNGIPAEMQLNDMMQVKNSFMATKDGVNIWSVAHQVLLFDPTAG
jgi:hypothetical protein